MRKAVLAALLVSGLALGQQAPNVINTGTPSRPVWVTGTVNVNALSISSTDGGGLSVTASNPSVQDAGAAINQVVTKIAGNNNGTTLMPALDDAGAWSVNSNVINLPLRVYFDGGAVNATILGQPIQVYFDGGVVTATVTNTVATTVSGIHQVYFDGGSVNATIVGIPQVYFDGGSVVVSAINSTVTVSGTVAATQSGTWTQLGVQGMTATNQAVTNPVVVGTRAVTDGVAPTAVTATLQGSAIGDTYGRPMVQTWHPRHWSCNINSDAGVSLCQGAPGTGGDTVYITDINLSCVTVGGCTASILTGLNGVCAGGTVATLFGTVNLPNNGPFSTNLQTPIKAVANQAVCCSTSQPTTCNLEGFVAP